MFRPKEAYSNFGIPTDEGAEGSLCYGWVQLRARTHSDPYDSEPPAGRTGQSINK